VGMGMGMGMGMVVVLLRCENLKLGWRIESWVLFYRGFTNLGFFCSNGGKIREKVNSEAICKCDNI